MRRDAKAFPVVGIVDAFPPDISRDGPLLFLDAGGLAARAGVWDAGRWLGYQEQSAPALEGLFSGARAALADAKLSWPDIRGFLFVEGPGSVLGLRLAAMAIRTWQADDAAAPSRAARPVWACGSLHLAALLARAGGAVAPFSVCTHARQNAWWVFNVTCAGAAIASLPPPRIVEGEFAPPEGGPLFIVPARKHGAPPARAKAMPVALRDHPEILAEPGLFRASPTATPLPLEESQYRKWKGPNSV